MYLMTVPYPVALFLAWTLSEYHLGFTSLTTGSSTIAPSNVAGRTKKTIMSSGTFLGYCVGNMCGSQIFKTKDAPRYIPGTIGCAVCLGAEFVLIVLWRVYYVWQNKRRDMQALASGLSMEEQERLGRQLGEMDVTDLKNPHFRFVASALAIRN
jgi:MFS transporter, ACS family, allantoate permease